MGFTTQTFLYQVFIIAYFVFAMCKPKWALLALPLFFPAYLLSFTMGGIPFTVVECLIYVTFFAFIGRLVLNKFFIQKVVFSHQIWLPVLLLLFAAIVSVLIVPKEMLLIDGKTLFASQKIALGILKGWIVAPILMFALFAFFLREEKDFRYLLDFYAASAVLLAFWALYQVATKQYITADMRASGPFISANYLALYITPAVFYVFTRLRNFLDIFHFHGVSSPSKEKFKKICTFALFLALFAALLFTKSYAAILALVLAVICYLSISRGLFFSKRLYLGIIAAVFAIILIIIFLDPAKWQMFTIITERTSSAVRLEVYQVAVRLIAEHPFFGLGLGQFPAWYQLEAPHILGHAPYEWNMLHPHNIFLAFWLNLGLIGLSSFIWILVLCAQKAWSLLKIFHKQSFDSFVWIKIIGFFMLFIIVFHGFFDTPFFKNDLALLFWLVIGIILLPLSRNDVKKI